MKIKAMSLLGASALLFAACQGGEPQLGKASVDKVLKAMTLEEKVHFVIGTGMTGLGTDEGVAATIGATKNIVPGAAGTTYPIAIYDQAFDIYQTGYVPTTIFIDQNGHILPASNGYSEHAIVGANSYENWAELVESFLK